MYEDVKEYLNWYDTRKDMTFAQDAPVIGLVLQRSHLVTGDEGHYSGVVSEMESLGAKVGPAMHATQPMYTQSAHYGSNSLRIGSCNFILLHSTSNSLSQPIYSIALDGRHFSSKHESRRL